MSKLFEMLRIGICPIGYLIVQELGLNLRGLVPGTRGDWIGLVWKGKDWIEKDYIGKDMIGMDGLERIGLERIGMERIGLD